MLTEHWYCMHEEKPKNKEHRQYGGLGTVEDQQNNRAELHIKGPLMSMDTAAQAIPALRQLASKYDTCVVYINTPGGDVAIATEILGVLKTFDTVITFGTGQVASAGFIIWASGDIRVAEDYTCFLAHRERYSWTGNTNSHKTWVDYNETHLRKLCVDMFNDILTETELNRITFEDVLLSADQLIERGCAISSDAYHQGENLQYQQIGVMLNIDSKCYVYDPQNELLTEVLDIKVGDTISAPKKRYGIHDIIFKSEKLTEPQQKETKKNGNRTGTVTRRKSKTE